MEIIVTIKLSTGKTIELTDAEYRELLQRQTNNLELNKAWIPATYPSTFPTIKLYCDETVCL